MDSLHRTRSHECHSPKHSIAHTYTRPFAYTHTRIQIETHFRSVYAYTHVGMELHTYVCMWVGRYAISTSSGCSVYTRQQPASQPPNQPTHMALGKEKKTPRYQQRICRYIAMPILARRAICTYVCMYTPKRSIAPLATSCQCPSPPPQPFTSQREFPHPTRHPSNPYSPQCHSPPITTQYSTAKRAPHPPPLPSPQSILNPTPPSLPSPPSITTPRKHPDLPSASVPQMKPPAGCVRSVR